MLYKVTSLCTVDKITLLSRITSYCDAYYAVQSSSDEIIDEVTGKRTDSSRNMKLLQEGTILNVSLSRHVIQCKVPNSILQGILKFSPFIADKAHRCHRIHTCLKTYTKGMDYGFIHVSGSAGGVAIPWVSPQELPLSMRMASTPYLYHKNVKLSMLQFKINQLIFYALKITTRNI